ncbi:hypothetical protein C3L33_16270, partial [Rhododendron williamsianum]
MMSILTTHTKKKKNDVDSVELCIEAKRGMENTNDGAEVSENEIITYKNNGFKFRCNYASLEPMLKRRWPVIGGRSVKRLCANLTTLGVQGFRSLEYAVILAFEAAKSLPLCSLYERKGNRCKVVLAWVVPFTGLLDSESKSLNSYWMAKPLDSSVSGVKQKSEAPITEFVNDMPSVNLSKKLQKLWSCSLCKVAVTCELDLKRHLQGRKYKAKEKAIAETNQKNVDNSEALVEEVEYSKEFI